MKRTPIEKFSSEGIPGSLRKYLCGARIYDSSCSPEARVYMIECEGGEVAFLKRAAAGTLKKEVLMTEYFHSLSLGTEVIEYISCDSDYLLTRGMKGEDCTHTEYLREPERLADLMGTELRRLHEIRNTGCPITDRTSEYIRTALDNYESGNYDKSAFPDSFGYRCAEDAYRVLTEGAGELKRDVLIHGDFCLPNIMLDGWRLSGYIDLGNGGICDRHVDLFWGAWTLWFNLGTDKYRDRFFDAYGRDRINLDTLKIIAAAEVFG